MLVLEVIFVCIIVGILAVVVNGFEDYHISKDSIKTSFANTMGILSLPIINLTNNNKVFNFIVDTGATISIVDSNVLNNFEYDKMNTIGDAYGIDGNKVPVSYVKMKLGLEGVSFMEAFQVMRMPAFDNIKQTEGFDIAGILGSTFLDRYNFILDFKELVMYTNSKSK